MIVICEEAAREIDVGPASGARNSYDISCIHHPGFITNVEIVLSIEPKLVDELGVSRRSIDDVSGSLKDSDNELARIKRLREPPQSEAVFHLPIALGHVSVHMNVFAGTARVLILET